MMMRPVLEGGVSRVLVALAFLAMPARASAQQLDGGPCPRGGFGDGEDPRQECALLTVPLDDSNPDGATIDVAVSRIQTADPAKCRGVIAADRPWKGNSRSKKRTSR